MKAQTEAITHGIGVEETATKHFEDRMASLQLDLGVMEKEFACGWSVESDATH
jgi:hypothetical protein